MSSKHFKDLRHAYAKYMEYHGIGYALYNPVAAEDITPPCVGYFNDNGDWNLIANLTTEPTTEGLTGLAYQPRPVTQIDISWQPKTSLGVDAQVVDTAVETPSQLPGGAGLHVKYSSKFNFLGVLMTTNPVTQVAYNEERLFTTWLQENRTTLYKKHGAQLKQFGLWLITKTHAAPHCSINATANKSQDVTVSLSAKAHMLGEVSEDVSWKDELYDKDWSHYNACTPGGLVVFIDGIFVNNWEWKLEPFKSILPRPSESSRRAAAAVPSYGRIDPIVVVPPPQIVVNEHPSTPSPPLQADTAHFPSAPELRQANATPQNIPRSSPQSIPQKRRPSRASQSRDSTPEFQDAQQEIKALNRLSLDERILPSHLSVGTKKPSPYPSVQQLQQQHTQDWIDALRQASQPTQPGSNVQKLQGAIQEVEQEAALLGDSSSGAIMEERILRDIGAYNSLARTSSLRRARDSIPSSQSPPRPRQNAEQALQSSHMSKSRSQSQSKSRSRSRSQSGQPVRSSRVVSLYLDSSENVVDVEKTTFRAAVSPPAPTSQGMSRSRSLSQSHRQSRVSPQTGANIKQAWHPAQLVRIQSPRSLRRETRSISSTMSGSESGSGLSDLYMSDVDVKDAAWA